MGIVAYQKYAITVTFYAWFFNFISENRQMTPVSEMK